MGCTTYVAALLIERLKHLNVRFIDYPHLIRLNPNIPWKTRGNGALCLRFRCDIDQLWKIEDETLDVIENNSDLEHGKTDPGAVFFFGDVPTEVREFSQMALRGIVRIRTAIKLIRMFKAEAFGFKGGRGIIGGLAAIGNLLEEDHTYELIAYRTKRYRGTTRLIDASSVFRMDRETSGLTFNNVDPETGRILITPRGPDPVLFGIRGENPQILKYAFSIVKPLEPIDRWVIYRTNQGTDAHLNRVTAIKEVKPYHPVIVEGTVASTPRVLPGGHVVFSIKDQSGTVDCAAYEPTSTLVKVSRKLIVGDVVEVYGGVKPPSGGNPKTINLEKLKIKRLKRHVIYVNPKCPVCGKRMKSMGKGKGFKCKKCGFRSSKMKKIPVEVERDIQTRLYITAPRSQRHLTKPYVRYGLEKRMKEPLRSERLEYSEFFGLGSPNCKFEL